MAEEKYIEIKELRKISEKAKALRKEAEAKRKKKEAERASWNNSWSGMAWNGLSKVGGFLSGML